MQQFESVENIPTWSLPYLINDDPTGLTDEEIKMVDDFVKQWQVQTVSPIEVNGEAQPELSSYPPVSYTHLFNETYGAGSAGCQSGIFE